MLSFDMVFAQSLLSHRRDGLELAPLLERHEEVSTFHAPLFTAVVHHYPAMLESLFASGLQLTPEISSEHVLERQKQRERQNSRLGSASSPDCAQQAPPEQPQQPQQQKKAPTVHEDSGCDELEPSRQLIWAEASRTGVDFLEAILRPGASPQAWDPPTPADIDSEAVLGGYMACMAHMRKEILVPEVERLIPAAVPESNGGSSDTHDNASEGVLEVQQPPALPGENSAGVMEISSMGRGRERQQGAEPAGQGSESNLVPAPRQHSAESGSLSEGRQYLEAAAIGADLPTACAERVSLPEATMTPAVVSSDRSENASAASESSAESGSHAHTGGKTPRGSADLAMNGRPRSGAGGVGSAAPERTVPSRSVLIREPRQDTESLSLLMCAASVGNLNAVLTLLAQGVLPYSSHGKTATIPAFLQSYSNTLSFVRWFLQRRHSFAVRS